MPTSQFTLSRNALLPKVRSPNKLGSRKHGFHPPVHPASSRGRQDPEGRPGRKLPPAASRHRAAIAARSRAPFFPDELVQTPRAPFCPSRRPLSVSAGHFGGIERRAVGVAFPIVAEDRVPRTCRAAEARRYGVGWRIFL